MGLDVILDYFVMVLGPFVYLSLTMKFYLAFLLQIRSFNVNAITDCWDRILFLIAAIVQSIVFFIFIESKHLPTLYIVLTYAQDNMCAILVYKAGKFWVIRVLQFCSLCEWIFK